MTTHTPVAGSTRRPGRAERYAPTPWAQQRLYRPFVRSAVVVGLTLGFAPGAILLGQLALGRSWLDWYFWREMHGIAQIYGWTGLFIFGFASHIVPRFRGNARIAFPWPQRLILALVLIGLVFALAPSLFPTGDQGSRILTVAGAVALTLAASVFAFVLGAVLRRGESSNIPFERWLWCGLAWLVASGALLAGSETTSAPALREAALVIGLYGFAGNFLFGISLRATTGFLRLRPSLIVPEQVAFALLNTAVLAMGTALAFEADPRLLATFELGYASGTLIFIAALRVFEPPAGERSAMTTARFLLVAYGWLTVTAFLMAASAIAEFAGAAWQATALPVMHTYAMGFLTMSIFGFALRVLPLLEARQLPQPELVTPTFVLLNLSVVLRLAGLSWTNDSATWTIAVSGILGLSAMVLFSLNAWPLCAATECEPEPVAAARR